MLRFWIFLGMCLYSLFMGEVFGLVVGRPFALRLEASDLFLAFALGSVLLFATHFRWGLNNTRPKFSWFMGGIIVWAVSVILCLIAELVAAAVAQIPSDQILRGSWLLLGHNVAIFGLLVAPWSFLGHKLGIWDEVPEHVDLNQFLRT